MTATTTYPDLAGRDEYLDDRLNRAAEIVWLWACGDTGREDDELVPDGWFEQTMHYLRLALNGHEVHDVADIPHWVYWRALEIMNLPRSYASSSRVAERRETEAVADFDPEPARAERGTA